MIEDKIKQTLNIYTLENVVNYIKDIMFFFLKPRIFFISIFQKPKEEKFKQVLFYVLSIIILFYIISPKELKTIVKTILLAFSLQAIIDLIPIIAALLLTNRLKKKPINAENLIPNVCIFLICSYTFILPIIASFIFIFEKTESYGVLIIAMFTFALFFLFRQLYISKIFYSKIKDMIIYIAINILIFNILIIFINFTIIDNFISEKAYEFVEFDEIIKEFEKNEAKIITLNGEEIPQVKFFNSKCNCAFYAFTEKEIISVPKTLAQKSINVKAICKHNVKILSELIDSLKFERNKILFKQRKIFYNNILEWGNKKENSKNAILKIKLKDKDSLFVYSSIEHINLSNKIVSDESRLYEMNKMSLKALIFPLIPYLFPHIIVQAYRDNLKFIDLINLE